MTELELPPWNGNYGVAALLRETRESGTEADVHSTRTRDKEMTLANSETYNNNTNFISNSTELD